MIGRERSVTALYVALASNSTGHTMLTVVLGLQVYDITRREFDLGVLGVVSWLPIFALVLVTGSAADRLDRRLVVATALGAGAVVSIGLAWHAASEPESVGLIFAIVALYGVTRSFVNPALTSMLADIVPEEQLPGVVAKGEVCNQASFIVAPIVGGALYVTDVRVPYMVVAALLLVSALVVLEVRPVPAADPAPVVRPLGEEVVPVSAARLADAFDGLRLIRANPILAGAISLDLFAVLLGGALVLLPAIADQQLGVGPIGVGWLRAAVGIGATLTSVWFAMRPLQRNVGRKLLRMVALFGAATIVLGVTRSFAVAFVAMVVLSGADAVSVVIRKTLVPLATPTEKRGRVIAFEQLFVGASNELGAFRSGLAGQALGAGGAVALGGVATIGIVVAWSSMFPALRDLDTFADGFTPPVLPDGGPP